MGPISQSLKNTIWAIRAKISLPKCKSKASSVTSALYDNIYFRKDSMMHHTSFLRQKRILQSAIDELEKSPGKNFTNLLILYLCSCVWISESSLLRRLFWPLRLCVPLLLPLKRKVFTSSFFLYVPSPWSWSPKCEGHSKQKTKNFYKNRMFFKVYIKICETAAPMWKVSWNKWLPVQRLVNL